MTLPALFPAIFPPLTSDTPTILFAGGGTGGHIFPNLAVAERLRELLPDSVRWQAHFVISDRPLDRKLLEQAAANFTPLAVRPFTSKPWLWPRWIGCWHRSMRNVKALIPAHRVAAVVASGGFVCGPVVVAAAQAGVAVALVNLDAVPGKANRATARHCETLFTVYPYAPWPTATHIGLPLRRTAVASGDAAASRLAIGLEPDRPTLLIFGGSQGANSLNRMIRPLLRVESPDIGRSLTRWQVLHVAGGRGEQVEALQRAYAEAAVPARVVAFCNEMGSAWGAASLAISRAGAGSVAEAQANAVPTIFLPYPHHRDQHQKLNAKPLVQAGGALVIDDHVDPARNATSMARVLGPLLDVASKRNTMRLSFGDLRVGDGATTVARWLKTKIESHLSDIL